MSDIQVKWGTYQFKGNATVVAKEIGSLGEEVSPEQIVEYAESNKDSELHKCFTWDDTVAARKWRIQEARLIVCNLVVEDKTDEEHAFTPRIRYFLRTEVNGGYKKVQEIIRNDDEYEKALRMAKIELLRLKNKYAILSDDVKIAEVFRAITLL